jgi:hypothetical protein
LRGTSGREFFDVHLIAGGGKIGIVVGRQHGHRENAQL